MSALPVGGPRPGERAIDPAIVRRASEWMARLWSGEAGEHEHVACAAWRAAHPDHERAWCRLQAVEAHLAAVPSAAARRVLLETPPALPSRRAALRLLGAAAVFGGAACAVRSSDAWQLATADHATATGEIRELALPDGTRVVLDTASAIDVRYSGAERRVVLRAGRVLIATAADPLPAHRPFLVECAQGTARALGTRFSVREAGDTAQVAVQQGAVEIRPRHAPGSVLRLDAGQRSAFSGTAAQPARPAQEADAAWAQGNLLAEHLRVADLVAELARYRPGILRCDAGAAELRVTGVFPLRDTDRALANLMLGVPVEVLYRTRYWATVQRR